MAQDNDHPLFEFSTNTHNKYWNTDTENQDISLLTYFAGIKYQPIGVPRDPLNLSVVIDRSGSMEGIKLEKTLEAVQRLIDRLQPNDFISIVAYDTEVEVIAEPTPVLERKLLKTKVQKIKSDGSTNLSGGLEKGYELVSQLKKRQKDSRFTNRVILLSDGLANVGIVDPKALQQLAKRMLNSENISLSTLGVGADYNEDLMTDLAIAGTGNYHFIESGSDIPKIFDEELDQMSYLIARDVKVDITFPSEAVEIRQVYLFNYDLVDGNTIRFNLNEIYSENEKALLTDFRVKPGHNGPIKFSAKLSYQNVIGKKEKIEEKAQTVITPTDDEKLIRDNDVQFAHLGRSLMLSGEFFKRATDAAKDRRFEESEDLVELGIEVIDQYSSKFGKHTFLEDMKNQLKEYKKELKVMQKKPKKGFNLFIKKFGSLRHGKVICPKFR